MTERILALIDASTRSDAAVVEAIRLAAEANVPLILGIDPKDEPFETLAGRISHWLDLAAACGVRVSTLLVNIGDADRVTRAACANRIDLVVSEQRRTVDPCMADVLRALESAEIRVVLVSGPAQTLVAA